MGEIAQNVLYRSNHPICNGKQVKEIVLYANNARIKTIINLSDSPSMLRSKVVCSSWYNKIFNTNNVVALNIPMHFDITGKTFARKLKECILFMIEREPPFLIHCEVGIDRTGFLSILLEAFMGASFSDIVKDYMLSFVDEDAFSNNDYKAGTLFITDLFAKIKGNTLNKNDSLKNLSAEYLIKNIGLSNECLTKLENKLRQR